MPYDLTTPSKVVPSAVVAVRETIRKNRDSSACRSPERQALLYGCGYFSRFMTAAAMDGVEKIVNRARRSFSEY